MYVTRLLVFFFFPGIKWWCSDEWTDIVFQISLILSIWKDPSSFTISTNSWSLKISVFRVSWHDEKESSSIKGRLDVFMTFAKWIWNILWKIFEVDNKSYQKWFSLNSKNWTYEERRDEVIWDIWKFQSQIQKFEFEYNVFHYASQKWDGRSQIYEHFCNNQNRRWYSVYYNVQFHEHDIEYVSSEIRSSYESYVRKSSTMINSVRRFVTLKHSDDEHDSDLKRPQWSNRFLNTIYDE